MLAAHGQWLPNDSIPTLYQTRRVVYELTNREPRPTRLDRLKATLANLEHFTLVRGPALVTRVEEGWASFAPEERARLLTWASDDYLREKPNQEDAGIGQRLAVRWWLFINRPYVARVVDGAERAMNRIADEIFHQEELFTRASDSLIIERLEESQRNFPTSKREEASVGANVGEAVDG